MNLKRDEPLSTLKEWTESGSMDKVSLWHRVGDPSSICGFESGADEHRWSESGDRVDESLDDFKMTPQSREPLKI